MKKIYISLFYVLFFASYGHCQFILKGNVHNKAGEILPMVNIVFYDLDDSLHIVNHGITDMEGNYEISDITPGSYQIILSYLGFTSIRDTLYISESQIKNYTLEEKTEALGEIEISADRIRISAEKVSYIISSQDIQGKTNAFDLLKIIPSIIVDPINQTISSAGEKQVKILLNGMSVNEKELQTIRPENIIRLEHFEIPPARYAAYETVVNVITKKKDTGLSGGLSLNHAFSTGFSNDMLFLSYNFKSHQIGFNYSLGYRNQNDRRSEIVYMYNFNDIEYKKQETVRDAFGYNQHLINLTYTYQPNNNSTFQIKLSPNYMDLHSKGKSIIILKADDKQSEREGDRYNKRKELNPVIDLYYWRKISDKDELMVNAVGTGFFTTNKYINKEYEIEKEELLLNNDVSEKNRKKSLISELFYSRKMYQDNKLNISYLFEAYKLNSHIVNTFGDTQFNTSLLQNYLYTEWVGQKEKWGYNLSIGLTHKKTDTYMRMYSDWIFRPFLAFEYNIQSNQKIRFSFERKNNEPSISNLNTNKTYITDHIIEQGNPFLRHSITNKIALNYSLVTKPFVLNMIPLYTYIESSLNRYFMNSADYIIRTSENAKSQYQYGIQYNLKLQPFKGNFLSVTFNGGVLNTKIKSVYAGNYSHLYTPFHYQIDLNYKNFSAYYQGRIVGKSLIGSYLNTDDNSSTIEIRYMNGNFSCSLGCFWPFSRSKYHTYTIPESIVFYDSTTEFYDSASMIMLGVTYYFDKGLKFKQEGKKLQNKDTDSGVFYK